MRPTRELDALLATLQPALQPGRYAFVALPPDADVSPGDLVATMREADGVSAIVPTELALAHGWPVAFSAAWITLTVHSDLEAVGLTAAFSTALCDASISCNVVAGLRHDHLFVPAGRAHDAMAVLQALQDAARSASGL